MTTSAKLAAELEIIGDEAVRRGLRTVGEEIDKLNAKQSNDTGARKQADNLRTVSQAAFGTGLALTAGFAFAERATIGFDKAMSGVGAVAGATSAELDQLREAAMQAGADTAFSASEAADAEAELARAGVSVGDILGGALSGSLNLAAAGQISVAESAEIAAQAMNIFNLQGSQVGHVADLLAAGANKSAAGVSDLGQALQQGGLVAQQTGLSIEDTVGVLSLFADNALKGSDAGTSLKTMLQRLTPQSDEAAQTMDALGISAYDASGNFIGLEGFAQSLAEGLSGLTAEQRNSALATIFGSDAVRAASILYQAGAEGVAEYTAAVDDQGAASRMAADQLDNLAGDLEQLSGSLETALIEGGSKATGVLRGMTQAATGLVNEFSQAPGWLQGTAIGIAGVGGAALTAVGSIGMIAPKIKEGLEAIRALSTGSQLALGGLAAGLTIGTVLLAKWAQGKEEARQKIAGYTDALLADTAALADNTLALGEASRAELGKNFEGWEGDLAAADITLRDLGVAFNGVTEAALRLRATKIDDAFFDYSHSSRDAEQSISAFFGSVDVSGQAALDLAANLAGAEGPLERFAYLAAADAGAAESFAAMNGLASNSTAQLILEKARHGDLSADLAGKLGAEADALTRSADEAKHRAAVEQDVVDVTERTARLMNDYDGVLGKMGVSHKLLVNAINNETGARAKLDTILAKNDALSGSLANGISELYNATDLGQQGASDFAIKLGAVDAATLAVGDSTDNATGSVGDFGGEVQNATDALDAYKGTLDSIIGAAVGVEQANLNYLDQLQAITEAVAENGTTLDLNTEQGRANRQELAGAASDIQSLVEAILEQTGSTELANAALAANTGKLAETMRQAGYTEQQIADVTTSLGLIPAITQPKVEEQGAAASKNRVDDLKRSIDGLDDKTVQLTVRAAVDWVADQLPGFAGGGDPPMNGAFLVGEAGPEIMYRDARGVHVIAGPETHRTLANYAQGAPAATAARITSTPSRTDNLLEQLVAELARVKQPVVLQAYGHDARDVALELDREASRRQLALPRVG